jgi:hypothetical protein
MALQDAFGDTSTGLDRGLMRAYIPVDASDPPLNAYAENNGTDRSEVTDGSPCSSDTPTRRFSRKLRSKLHIKKKALRRDRTREPDPAIVEPVLAPQPPATAKKDRFSELPPDKPTLPPLKDFIQHPLKAATSIAQVHGGDDFAQNLATTAATHEASVKVVRAYDKIAETTTKADEDKCRKDLELLKKSRQDAFVRWTLDRHVHKVGKLKVSPSPMKPMKDFAARDQDGSKVKQWEEYGGYVRILLQRSLPSEQSSYAAWALTYRLFSDSSLPPRATWRAIH